VNGLTLPVPFPALVAVGFLVSLVTVAIPGPITMVATHLALDRRISAAVWFLVGTTVLDALLFASLAAGAGPALRRIGALPLVEIVGGLVLLWGGVASLRRRSPGGSAHPPVRHEPHRPLGYFALGLLVSAANPHYWIWWVTAGLAFVEVARAHGTPGLAWMLAALIAGVVAWYIPLLWALHRGRTLLSPRRERLVVAVMGTAIVLLGAGLIAFGTWRLL
jgi:threonine/homoserine/homoserine lactone efflux protein